LGIELPWPDKVLFRLKGTDGVLYGCDCGFGGDTKGVSAALLPGGIDGGFDGSPNDGVVGLSKLIAHTIELKTGPMLIFL
jgi:hypothetical protein